MKESKRYKVLIVDDALDNIRILIDLLCDEYETYFAKTGEKALELVNEVHPDIILLDIVLPHLDGYGVCSQLKKDKAFSDIPVIFISSRDEVGDETKGLRLGAVDYITKPIRPSILQARIRNHLKLSNAMSALKRLYQMALDANPLTGLPGNNSISRRIESALVKQEEICVIYSDLDNFKAYNDKYGFAKGDEVILFNCFILQKSLLVCGVADYFIGHIGGDDFVMAVPGENAKDVCRMIVRHFDEGIDQFYNETDRKRKYIVAYDRSGEKQLFPLISISLAGVHVTHTRFEKYIQVNDACMEGKKRAKAIDGSAYVMERRREPTQYEME